MVQYPLVVIPAKAGIQSFQTVLDPAFAGVTAWGNEIFLKLMTLIFTYQFSESDAKAGQGGAVIGVGVGVGIGIEQAEDQR